MSFALRGSNLDLIVLLRLQLCIGVEFSTTYWFGGTLLRRSTKLPYRCEGRFVWFRGEHLVCWRLIRFSNSNMQLKNREYLLSSCTLPTQVLRSI